MRAWILSLILALSPPSRAAALPPIAPQWAETAQVREDRMRADADAIAGASHTPSDAVVLVAIAFLESGFAPDVDIGPCYRGRDGRSSRCDAGRAFSIFQLHVWADASATDLTDRNVAAKIAIGMHIFYVALSPTLETGAHRAVFAIAWAASLFALDRFLRWRADARTDRVYASVGFVRAPGETFDELHDRAQRSLAERRAAMLERRARDKLAVAFLEANDARDVPRGQA